jgi:enamine deaminase RidA (YjgF/YER057c/UK114 family)
MAMINRQHVFSGTPWEKQAGYCRALRAGNLVFVSGTTSMDGDQLVGLGSSYKQARFIFSRIERALEEAGSCLAHVVRTRMYVTDISGWEEVSKAHAEVFLEIFPAATLVEVSRLIEPDLLVEIEVDAVIP